MSLKGMLANLDPSQVEELVNKLRSTDEYSKLIDQFNSPSEILNALMNKIEGNPDGVLKQLISRLYPDGLDASEKEALERFDRLSHEDSQLSETIEGATETVSEAVMSGVSEAGELLGTVAKEGGELLSTVGEASGELLSAIAEFLSSL